MLLNRLSQLFISMEDFYSSGTLQNYGDHLCSLNAETCFAKLQNRDYLLETKIHFHFSLLYLEIEALFCYK